MERELLNSLCIKFRCWQIDSSGVPTFICVRSSDMKQTLTERFNIYFTPNNEGVQIIYKQHDSSKEDCSKHKEEMSAAYGR